MSVILVTGGAGFIGSNLVDFLLRDNTVIVVDDFDAYYDLQIKEDNIKNSANSDNFFLYKFDIKETSLLDDVFSRHRPDSVIHLAGNAGVRPSISNPALYVNNNIQSTVSLLECMKKHNTKKIIFASSSSVYGNIDKEFMSTEENCCLPISPYAASKLSCEQFLYTYAHLYRIRAYCLRFFTVYGPRQRPDLAIHKFIKNIYNGQPINIFGDGQTARDYTYIDDIIQGINSALNYNGSIYEIINLGNGKPITLANMVQIIEKVLEKKAVIHYTEKQPGDVNITCADISKARRLLNYSPQISFETGIRKYVNWLKKYNKL